MLSRIRLNVGFCAGYLDAITVEGDDACCRPASEKRYGTKSKKVTRRDRRQAPWGFDGCRDGGGI
jgi:hypothetical protein